MKKVDTEGQRAIAEYLARGGKITYVPQGVSGRKEGEKVPQWGRKAGRPPGKKPR